MTLTYTGAFVRLALLFPVMLALAFGPNLWRLRRRREKRRRGYRALAGGVWR